MMTFNETKRENEAKSFKIYIWKPFLTLNGYLNKTLMSKLHNVDKNQYLTYSFVSKRNDSSKTLIAKQHLHLIWLFFLECLPMSINSFKNGFIRTIILLNKLSFLYWETFSLTITNITKSGFWWNHF